MHGTIIRKLIRYAVRIISHDSLDAINTASSTKYFLFYDKLSWGFYSIRNKFIFTLKYMHEKITFSQCDEAWNFINWIITTKII